ncbi:MAG: type II and III secretion system protein family protein [Candidatus Acidiferrales bacterium]
MEQEAGPGAEGIPESLHLMVGRSLIITSPTRIKRISIADPNIADATLVSPIQILVTGKTPGGVSLIVWDEVDRTEAFDIFVDLDIMGISQKIREVFPQEQVQIEASKDVVILSGSASSSLIADKIVQVVSSTTPKVVSLIQVPTAPTKGEILLEVRFAEVNRAALDQAGINLFSTGATNTIGQTTTQQFSPLSLQSLESSSGGVTDVTFNFSDLLNIFVFRPDLDLGATIRALKQRNLLQILAEPNLLTQTGKEASFLAGGEFPFPVVQGGTNFTSVTIQFKEFGVRLTFTPTLTVDDTIHLKVQPEVSALDFANAVSLSGFLVPALSTRRVQTEMELRDGQSFAIAGLVDDRLTETMNKIPVLGDIPILGYLFRSRTLNKSKTELLVLVTPRIVKPAPAQALPREPQFPKPFLPPSAPEQPKQPGQ